MYDEDRDFCNWLGEQDEIEEATKDMTDRERHEFLNNPCYSCSGCNRCL